MNLLDLILCQSYLSSGNLIKREMELHGGQAIKTGYNPCLYINTIRSCDTSCFRLHAYL